PLIAAVVPSSSALPLSQAPQCGRFFLFPVLQNLESSAHRIHLRWLLCSSKVSGVRFWGTALVKISPHTFSAVGISVSIGVSVLSAAWGIYVLQSRLPESLPRISLGTSHI
ncbi:hypothetical protein HN51_055589, partial [Arachis hypogaea]